MKLKILPILIIIVLLTFINFKKDALEKPQGLETSSNYASTDIKEKENREYTEETNDVYEAPKSQNEIDIYIGQALDTIDRDGFVEVYEKKDIKSKVIYKLKDYEKIELIETLPFGWFKVLLSDGTEGYVDSRYVRAERIPPHNYSEKVEGHALIFNHENQILKIYKDGKLMIESKGSSGLWDNFTPKGIFNIEKGRRGKWAYIERFSQGFKYWVGFKGTYLFHSVPFTKDGKVINEESEKLGQAASHGCIRLPVDVAKYIYDNVEEGSLVLIY